MALILRNGGSQSPDRWLRDPRNNHIVLTIPVVNIIRILENLFKGTVEIEIVIMTNIVNIVLTWLGIKIGTYIINTNKM